MIIFVGLGNPGEKYQKTRHNIGFRIIDEFARNYKFPDFKLSRLRPSGFGGQAKKFNDEISEGEINGQKIILAKPQTFMNDSGKAVKKLTYSLQLTTYNLLVIHDDIDLPLGKIKIVENRGSAGHKGVQSIINDIKTKDFVRFRIGIQPKIGKPKNPEKFVLQKFNKEEEKILKKIIKKTVDAIEMFLMEGLEKTMSEYNK